MHTITHAHDKFIRTAMSDPRVARDFFVAHLPSDILAVTDLTHLVFEPRSYINDVRKESTVDILYKTTIAGEEAYLYLLLEHQSTPDALMAFRILKYTCNIIDQHLKNTGDTKIPLIYPMVIYHGERPYPYSTDIKDLIDAPRELIEQYFLKPFHLIDLGKIEDAELKKHALAGVMEFGLKHVVARDILQHLRGFADFLRRVDQLGNRNYISLLLEYLLDRADIENKKEFFEIINREISPEVGDNVMTLAERLRVEGMRQGIQQGREEGIEKTAARLLAEKVELAIIAKATGLSLDRLKQLQS